MSHLADGKLHYRMDTVTGYTAEGTVHVTAEQWARIQAAIREVTASPADMLRWFSPAEKPAEIGFYERQYPGNEKMEPDYWDGKEWIDGQDFVHPPVRCAEQALPWRICRG